MIHARSRHLKSKAVNKWVINQITILPSDWLKSRSGTKKGLGSTFWTIFSSKFGPSTIKCLYAEFRYHGKWGTGSNGTKEVSRHRPPYWIEILVAFLVRRCQNCSVNLKFCFYPHLTLYIVQFSGHFRNEIRDLSLKNA